MTGVIFLKVLGDLCLICAVIASFPLLFVHDFIILLPVLMCSTAAALAAYFRMKGITWAGFAALLLPLAALLFADSLMEYLILTPLILYTGAVIIRGAFALEYYTFREQFLHTLTLLGVFGAVVFALGYFEGMIGSSWSTYDITGTLFYGLLFAFTGVFQLRQLRMGADLRPEDQLRNNVQMFIVLCVILGLTLGILAVEDMMHGFITWILGGVMSVVGFIPMVIHELIRWFMKDDGGEYVDAMEQVDPTTAETSQVTYPDLQGTPATPTVQQDDPMLMALLILIVLGIVLVILLRTLSDSTGARASSETVETVEPERAGRKQPRSSNRGKVRRLYRSYLKMVRRKGQKLRTDQTSRDILDAMPENTEPEASARLRQIYLKARYADDQAITDRDVEEAKKALKRADKHKL